MIESLGFKLVSDARFEKGHPIIMQHSSGNVLNLLGPADEQPASNVLMDIEAKHAGITRLLQGEIDRSGEGFSGVTGHPTHW